MGLSADAHSIFRHALDPHRVFCAGCAHSEFIHSDDGSRRCLYSECKCSAWRGRRANATTRSRPSCRPRSMIDGGVDIAESDGDGSSVRADPGRGRNGLWGSKTQITLATSAFDMGPAGTRAASISAV
jgi:hypothetical protein